MQRTREIGQAWDWGRVARRYDSPGDGLRQEVGGGGWLARAGLRVRRGTGGEICFPHNGFWR